MTALTLLMSTAVFGIDYGWQPVAGDGYEYIIQIDPRMIQAMVNEEPILSDLPANFSQSVRRLRIMVGTGPLPNQGKPFPISPPITNASVRQPGGPVDERYQGPALTWPNDSGSGRTQFASTGTPPARIHAGHDGHESSPSDRYASLHSLGSETEKPWTPLMLALIALFTSLGANVYLGWMGWGFRERYRALLGQLSGR